MVIEFSQLDERHQPSEIVGEISADRNQTVGHLGRIVVD